MIKMTLYEVSFVCENSETPFGIGLFSSQESASAAIVQLREAPGFCDTPEGFYIIRREIPTESCPTEVYEALLDLHTDNYELDFGERLGFFLTREEALSALQQYHEDNPQEIPNVEAERIVNRYIIDKPDWAEGFVHY